jgi:amino acid adenylation domain-containing protein
VGAGHRVGLCCGKSLEAVAALLGIMHSGACAVPLDSAAPPARLALLARQARLEVLLAGPVQAQRLALGLAPSTGEALPAGEGASADPAPELAVAVVDDRGRGEGLTHLDVALERALGPPGPASQVAVGELATSALVTSRRGGRTPAQAASCAAEGDHSALVYFTSGSTGAPRGVMLSHRNVAHFVDWAVEHFALGATDRLTSHAPLHFDLSTLDLFAAFKVGASVHLLDETTVKMAAAVVRVLETQRITVLYCVPTALRALIEPDVIGQHDLGALRAVLFAGEPFAPEPLRKLIARLPRARFFNLYGPTETNVCTVYEVPRGDLGPGGALPIGTPCKGLSVTVRAADGRVLADGTVGEICVEGPTCMQGYLDDGAATAAKRLEGRYDSVRTGDLGAWRSDGNLGFHGRRDRQIKLRGHRLELDEIEAVVAQVPQVHEAAALVVGEGPHAQIVVYFSALQPRGELGEAILAACRAHLPAVACPARVIELDRLPHTSTGKLDRRALQALAEPEPPIAGSDLAHG